MIHSYDKASVANFRTRLPRKDASHACCDQQQVLKTMPHIPFGGLETAVCQIRREEYQCN